MCWIKGLVVAGVLSPTVWGGPSLSLRPGLLSVEVANRAANDSRFDEVESGECASPGLNRVGGVPALRLETMARPRIAGARRAAGTTMLEIAADTNFAYRVETSTDLAHWENIGWARTLSNGLFRFVGDDGTSHPMRFYRVLQAEIPFLRIAVLSDPHYMHSSLLISDGPAFQNYLFYDQKLLRESAAILDSAIAGITNARPDIVLVPGDLTKDGELVGHQAQDS